MFSALQSPSSQFLVLWVYSVFSPFLSVHLRHIFPALNLHYSKGSFAGYYNWHFTWRLCWTPYQVIDRLSPFLLCPVPPVVFKKSFLSKCTHNSLNDFLALSVLEGHHKEEAKVGADSHPISLVNTQKGNVSIWVTVGNIIMYLSMYMTYVMLFYV